MHHDPDNQRGADQHDGQHWETGDGCQFPHIRCLIHRFTYRLNKKNLKLQHWKEGYHCMTQSWQMVIYIFSDRLTVLHVLHDGVFGYCLHDAHDKQRSKSEFQNSELPHWPAQRKTSSSSVSYASFISSLGNKAGPWRVYESFQGKIFSMIYEIFNTA